MRRIMRGFLGLCLIGMSMGPGIGFAEEGEVAALKAQIEILSRKLEAMDSKIMTLEKPAANTPAVYIPAPPAEKGGFLRTVEDINMGGYIDTQFQNTFETSKGANTGRVFTDRSKDTFSMNAAKLWFEKAANPEGGAGFRIDLLVGSDARYIDFNDAGAPDGTGSPATARDEFAFEQAYIQYIQPLSFWENSNILPHKVEFKAGRFATMAGYEVIEAPNNWNISRSVEFGYGLPFTHTGLRIIFGLLNDFFTVTTGINNGWDRDLNSQSYKSFEGAISFKPFKNATWTTSSHIGPEQTGAAGPATGSRFLVTNVLNYEVTSKLAVGGDFDFGNQRRVDLAGDDTFESAQWYGIAGYTKYKFTDKLSAAYRLELFKDADRYRNWTGVGVNGAMSDFVNTLTLEYKLRDNLIARGEYRIDYAHAGDGRVFNGEPHQSTLGGQLIYLFG